jgi:hypothetical protein
LADFRHKRRLKNYLLNSRLQLRYVGWVIAIAATVAAALGAVVYEQSSFASAQLTRTLQSPDMEWLDPVLRQQILERLTLTDTSLVLWMIGVGVVVATVLSATLVVMTHKVAGPIFRMAAHFEQLRTGRFTPIGSLRKGDQFGDVFEVLRATFAVLAERRRADLSAIDDLLAAAQAPGVTLTPEQRAAVDQLRAVRTEPG